MNEILRDFKNLYRVYIDNIVSFFKIFDEHVEYFRRLLVKLIELRIIFNLKKIFLNYFNITLFKQKIDVFDLWIIEKRIVVIKIIKFSKNFKILKIYLSLTNYQRKKLVWYAQKINVLQKKDSFSQKLVNNWEFKTSNILKNNFDKRFVNFKKIFLSITTNVDDFKLVRSLR